MGLFGNSRLELALAIDQARDEMEAEARAAAERATVITTDDMPSWHPQASHSSQWRWQNDDGESYPGGYGPTDVLITDYWTLRQRSIDLFERNLYARAVIRRLVTNEINTGLHLEATPEEELLGRPEDSLVDWGEEVENLFDLWSRDPRLCDHLEADTFGALQAAARREALIAGDVLVVIVQDRKTMLPRVQLVSGSAVQTPFGATPDGMVPGNHIVHGVELDPSGRHVAYWMRKRPDHPSDGHHGHVGHQHEVSRLPAMGRRGRKVAWLLYGSDKRLDDVRGKPMLSLVLQSLKEIDRYRDAVLRKAVLNGQVAIVIEKTEDKQGTLPMAGGAQRRGVEAVVETDGTGRSYEVESHIPGIVMQELQHGEKPHGFQSHGTDEKFGDFEEAILQSVAFLHEIPPEIYRLSFSSNYSASQAANNEFKLYLNSSRTRFGREFCQLIYNDWLLSQVLLQRIEASGLIEASRNPTLYEVQGAWVSADWSGHIKPSIDMVKAANAYETMVQSGFITRDRASRELTGTKFSKNIKTIKRENALVAEANEPIERVMNPLPEPSPEERDDDDENEDVDEETASVRIVPAAG